MRIVVCGECKKRYDFDKDDFCPRCGTFNPPQKQWTVDNYGNVVRVDGINERGHAGSFVHAEVHREKAVRKIKGLDRDSLRREVPYRQAMKVVSSTRSAVRSGKKGSAWWIGAVIAVLGLLMELFFG